MKAERAKYLLKLAQELRNVSEACRIFGCSRETFYRIKRQSIGGTSQEGLNQPCAPPHRSSYPSPVEEALIRLATTQPDIGSIRASRELGKLGYVVSPSTEREIWRRHNLATVSRRLVAFENSIRNRQFLRAEGEHRESESSSADNHQTVGGLSLPRS